MSAGESDAWPHCWCCGLLLDLDGDCPLCDVEGVRTSPPHVCEKRDRAIPDEHGEECA
jgi:hypothetical protein